MKSLHYPRRDVQPDDVFTTTTLELVLAQILSWRQGAGVIGGLHLHACWSMSGVLPKRYQGQTTTPYWRFVSAFQKLYERTEDVRWRTLVDDCVSNLLYLQVPGGGFSHAGAQLEPAFDPEHETCPIHQGMPLLVLLDYAAWPHADPRRVELIKPAIDWHWRWFVRRWWKTGTKWSRGGRDWREHRVDYPCFCGVTNQDLVVIAALARYATVFGDASRYEEFGKPVLDVILSPRIYHEKLGVFERGDQDNFVERTTYNEVNVPMLEIIHRERGDPRLPAVIDNVCSHLFDALHEGPDGLMHFHWGGVTDPHDKSAFLHWISRPYTIGSYPALLPLMRGWLDRHPSPEREAQYRAAERTVATYMLADGSLPVALGNEDPVFAIVPRTDYVVNFLIDRLGDQVAVVTERALPCVERSCGTATWRADARQWSLLVQGERRYAGLKCESYAIAIGPNEDVAGARWSELEKVEVRETIEFPAAEP